MSDECPKSDYEILANALKQFITEVAASLEPLFISVATAIQAIHKLTGLFDMDTDQRTRGARRHHRMTKGKHGLRRPK